MNSGENLRLQRADRRFEARVGETLFREDDGANIAISRNFWRSALRTGPAGAAAAAKGAGDKRLHRSAEQRRRGPAGAARAGRGVARVGRRGATPHLRRSCACRLPRMVCRACVPFLLLPTCSPLGASSAALLAVVCIPAFFSCPRPAAAANITRYAPLRGAGAGGGRPALLGTAVQALVPRVFRRRRSARSPAGPVCSAERRKVARYGETRTSVLSK